MKGSREERDLDYCIVFLEKGSRGDGEGGEGCDAIKNFDCEVLESSQRLGLNT